MGSSSLRADLRKMKASFFWGLKWYAIVAVTGLAITALLAFYGLLLR